MNYFRKFKQKRKELSLARAFFKQSRPKKISVFKISKDYSELPRRTIRANLSYIQAKRIQGRSEIFHNKASMDLTVDEFKFLTSTSWNRKYQFLTIDIMHR